MNCNSLESSTGFISSSEIDGAGMPTSMTLIHVCYLKSQAIIQVTFMIITICLITWYVTPAGVVELTTEVLAESWQVWLSVWHLVRVRRVEQHLGVGGAVGTFDLLQETSTFCVVGGENLETTRNKDQRLQWRVVNFHS